MISPPTGALADTVTVAGIVAFTNNQANAQWRMASRFVNNWYHLLKQLSFELPWLKQYPCSPESKHQHLHSNVQLYYPDTYTPHTNIPDELISNGIDSNPLSTIAEDFEDFTDY